MDIILKPETWTSQMQVFFWDSSETYKNKEALCVTDEKQVLLNTWVCSFIYQSNADNINKINFYEILLSEYS